MKERAEGQVQEPDRRTRLKLIEKIYRAEMGPSGFRPEQ